MRELTTIVNLHENAIRFLDWQRILHARKQPTVRFLSF